MFYTLLSFRALILKEIPGEHFPIKAAFVSVPLEKKKKIVDLGLYHSQCFISVDYFEGDIPQGDTSF